VVTIDGAPFEYTYRVNGAHQVIRGIGYNVAYAANDLDWRAARYDRDFAMMAAAGFNTLVGWDEREFDDLTMDKAQAYGLGVIWPYNLPPDGDYADPSYCAAQRDRVLWFVARYATHPALRMWGIGNEVLHDMPDAGGEARAAFGECYAEIVAAVHQADPNHPIIYRDSEDVWFDPVRVALQAHDLEQPWMVYGANIFTFRLRELIDAWPDRGLRVPLMISEYGPTGYGPADRPGSMLAMWELIRQGRRYVLGGSIYGWQTDGIEAIDRVYGLVDDDAQPVDGTLAAIAERFTSGRKANAATAGASSDGTIAPAAGSTGAGSTGAGTAAGAPANASAPGTKPATQPAVGLTNPQRIVPTHRRGGFGASGSPGLEH
jgi:beta-galactosidase/beta-glucuronidase